MAAKHATSKLRTFSDLYGNTSNGNGEQGNANACANDAEANTQSTSTMSTLGFRGEALFSLANISKSMVVSTRTSNENAGEEFAFDPQGNLIPETRRTVARGVGTTVTVNGLFERLPVRRVDLCKRIKTQRMKLIKVMQGCELAVVLR
jgi:DNA mismatch repair protein PMS2